MALAVQQLQADDAAYVKQAADAQNAKQAQEALQSGEQSRPSFLQKWVTGPMGRVTTSMVDSAVSAADSIQETPGMRKARDVAAGVITGATNMADAAGSALATSGREMAAAEDSEHADAAREGTLPTSPIWDHAKGAILDFRDAVAVQDPTLADNLVQAGAQLAIPFAGYSRALAGLHGFANIVGAGALTDATALGSHDPRMADLIALGRHVEGKLGETLRALAPDGSAQNAYINFLADRTNESEAEGRLKNVLDGFGANLVVTPLLHAVASGLKYGTAGLRYAIENGVGSAGDLMPAPQRGSIGMQAPELPAENRDPYSGKTQAPQLPDRGLRLVQQLHANDHTQGAGVQYNVKNDIHTATSDNGVTVAIQQGKNLRILSSETWVGRGQGEGTARIERLVHEAQAKGLTLTSDSEVSAPAQKVYERLRSQGYDIKENPSRLEPGTGVKHSTSELKGVYEVRPKGAPSELKNDGVSHDFNKLSPEKKRELIAALEKSLA